MIRESSSSSKPSSIPDNDGKHSNESRTDFCTKWSSPTDSVTQKMLDTTVTHPLNVKNLPARPNLTPSALSPCCSGRECRVPVCDDDGHYFVTSYGNWHTQDLGGKERNRQGQAGSSEGEDKVMNVTHVTDESAETAVLEDPIFYHDALSQDN